MVSNPLTMRLVRPCFLFFFLCVFSTGFSQKEYKINFKINGLKDTLCLIANYYGNATYIKDTLKVDGQGRCIFKASPGLPKGIYILVITDKVYLDFVINNDHFFSIETDKSNPIENVKITGSPENRLFYDYLVYNKKKIEEAQALNKEIKKHPDQKDSTRLMSDRIDSINKEMIRYKYDLIKKNPTSFISFMLNAMKEPDSPPIPKLPDGRSDSTYPYRFYKTHYWDDTDFTDDRLLRTPVFHNKLQKFLDKVIIQNPDTLIKEIDIMVEKARPNAEMFKYLIWFMTYHYEISEIMGFDKIFVHLVDRYYVTGQTPWVHKTVVENMIKKANKLRPLLLGQKAPNMIMVDTSNQLVSLHNIDSKFIIILFWDPTCSHCELEIPKIKEIYDQNRENYGLSIFAVCSDSSLVKWKESIRKKKMNWINVDGPRTLTGNYHDQYDIISTPVIYILNERKEIIAKKLAADQILTFIKNYIQLKNK